MKKLIVVLMVLSLATPLYAVTVSEKVNVDKSVDITISYTEDEYTMFSFDKTTSADWLLNAITINLKDKLRYETTLPSVQTPEEITVDLLKKAKKIKLEKDANQM